MKSPSRSGFSLDDETHTPSRVRWPASGGEGLALLRRFMVADHFGDDEVQELLGKIRIEVRFLRKRAQARDLLGFADWIGARHGVTRLQRADALRALESLRQQMNQGSIEIVDAGAELREFGKWLF